MNVYKFDWSFEIDHKVELSYSSQIKVHSRVTFALAFFFNFTVPFFENAKVVCEHHQILAQNPFLTFDATAEVTRKLGFT